MSPPRIPRRAFAELARSSLRHFLKTVVAVTGTNGKTRRSS